MFTVKHVTREGAHQFWHTDCVHTSEPRVPAVEYARKVYFVSRPDGVWIELPSGTIFVMNSDGQTVQRYDLLTEEQASETLETAA